MVTSRRSPGLLRNLLSRRSTKLNWRLWKTFSFRRGKLCSAPTRCEYHCFPFASGASPVKFVHHLNTLGFCEAVVQVVQQEEIAATPVAAAATAGVEATRHTPEWATSASIPWSFSVRVESSGKCQGDGRPNVCHVALAHHCNCFPSSGRTLNRS